MLDNMFGNYIAFLLVLVRTVGFLFLNPIFSRRNVPTLTKMGLAFCITLLISSTITQEPVVGSMLVFWIMAIKEFFIGWMFGYIVNLFLSMMIFSGEIYDLQMGISMAKVFDPASNIQMPIIGSVFNAIFIIFFFVSNSHLTLIKIFKSSFGIIPIGFESFNPDIALYIFALFSQTIALGAKIALPMLGAQMLVELGVGVLMKAVPQINVFSVNIQVKLIVGWMVMLVLLAPISNVIDNSIDQMLSNVTYGMEVLMD